MAGALLDRAFGAVEFLAERPGGAALQAVTDHLNMPKSGVHRLLADLIRLGYAHQDPDSGHYRLTPRLLALSFRHVTATGLMDAAQPILDSLARASGELVRLSVTDHDRQVWVARAQGARSGLRVDSQMGDAAHLSSTATGQAWLSCLDDMEALRLVAAQGFGDPALVGPNAPTDVAALITALDSARLTGFATVTDSSAPGTAAVAAPVRHPVTGAGLGTVSIGGPSVRLTPGRLADLAPLVASAATELCANRGGSTLLMSSLSPV
ncbi:MAG: IclR family transcriptional regulator [Rhodobacterales bacterium]|nr:IclR family transcriptional regulator [Rhodobacterales bacterium]